MGDTISLEAILKQKVRDLTHERDDLLVVANKQADEILQLKEKLEKYERQDGASTQGE